MQDYWDYKFRHVHQRLPLLNDSVVESQTQMVDVISYDVNEYVLEKRLTPLQIKWNSYLSIASTIPQVVVLLLNAAFGHKISIRWKLLTSLFGIILLFVLTDVMTQINTDYFQHEFLILTLVTAVFISCCIALLQVAI